ncbi:MAG TPA: hypothetical protein VF006_13495 [Longimicrobium sp.]
MTKRSSSVLTLSAAAFLLACGGNPPPDTPAPQAVESVAVQPAATAGVLSDERAMELARGYVALLHAGDYERLWQHVTPETKQRIGSLDAFRSGGEGTLRDLGAEITVVSERVEPGRTGMVADKMYLRVSHYVGAPGTAVRLMIGLKNDGTIVGMQIRRADQA